MRIGTPLKDKREIWFDSVPHTYVDTLKTSFISVTTLMHHYAAEFDEDNISAACARIGLNPDHEKFERYAGMTRIQITEDWHDDNLNATDNGTKTHNYIEEVCRYITDIETKFPKTDATYQKLYNIDEILDDIDIGLIHLDRLEESKIKKRFPKVYKLLINLEKAGYRIFPELLAYNLEHTICGCIDLLAIHPNGTFIIIDWKTNKAPISKVAGYYPKDNEKNMLLDQFKETHTTLYYLLQHLPDSTYHKYAMQLSFYAKMIEERGLKLSSIVIYHMHEKMTENDIEISDIHKNMPYFKSEVISVMKDFSVLTPLQLIQRRRKSELDKGKVFKKKSAKELNRINEMYKIKNI